MRQYLFCVLLPGLLLISSSVDAQDQRRVAISVAIGPAFPMSPEIFSDYWSMGLGVKGGIEKPLSLKARLIFELDLTRFPLNSKKVRDDLNIAGALSGGHLMTTCLTGNALFYLDEVSESGSLPYARIGLGFYHSSIAEAELTLGNPHGLGVSESDNTIMVQGGVGIEIATSGDHKFFIDAGLVFAATRNDPTLFIPVRVGMRTR